jgi:ubiquinone/menaquinone biosynthesis C-methylase UbiE
MPSTWSMNYELAADQYAVHRQVHPGVFEVLCQRLAPARCGGKVPNLGPTVLEVGCGTGNYISALQARFDCAAYGLDPSQAMLVHACTHPEPVSWILGRAERLCFASESFDLIFSVDVIHHITDRLGFYCQVASALRPGGQVCTVTDSEEIIRRREILSGYFSETVEYELARYPRLVQLQAWMAAAGLTGSEIVIVETPYELTNAQSFREKAYSALHLISEAAWQAGLERLEHALEGGPIRGATRYALMWGYRPT